MLHINFVEFGGGGGGVVNFTTESVPCDTILDFFIYFCGHTHCSTKMTKVVFLA